MGTNTGTYKTHYIKIYNLVYIYIFSEVQAGTLYQVRVSGRYSLLECDTLNFRRLVTKLASSTSYHNFEDSRFLPDVVTIYETKRQHTSGDLNLDN